MKSYRNYFGSGCYISEAPHDNLHLAMMRAHGVVDGELNDLFIADQWVSRVALEYLEWTAEGLISGDWTGDVDLEAEKFAKDYIDYISIASDDTLVTHPARWYAAAADTRWYDIAAKGYIEGGGVPSHDPSTSINGIIWVALSNIAKEFGKFVVERRGEPRSRHRNDLLELVEELSDDDVTDGWSEDDRSVPLQSYVI